MNPAQCGEDVLVHVTSGSPGPLGPLPMDAFDVALHSAAVAALPDQSALRSYLHDLALGRC